MFRSLITRTPSSFLVQDPLTSFTRDLDKMLTQAFAGSPADPVSSFGTALRLDVTEDDKAVTVTAECPGVDEKDIELSFTDGVLTIKGEKKFERDEKKETLHLVERSYGSFSRSIAIPAEVDAEKIGASFEKGVLTVTLPKQEKAIEKTRKIEIKTAS